MAFISRSKTKKISVKLTLVTLAVLLLFYGPGIFFFKALAPKASASALSFVCSSAAAATSTAACAGEQAGDLLLVMAGASTGGTIPTLATGFTSINTSSNSAGGTGTRTGMRAGWNTAASSSTGSGTWASATQVIMLVYRGQAASPIGNNAVVGGNNSANTVNYAADTLTATDSSSWFVGFAERNTASATLATAPSGMTNRASTPATASAAGHDTNGATGSNWSSTNVTGFSSSAKYTSIVIEIKAAPTITASATGTQAASMTIPSTANYSGGAFAFIRDVGSANVTSIKVHENGSVNANSNVSNLILYYKQETTCSTSIPAGVTQFNSTPGTFNASEDSTVTGTISVSTSQICVYATLDIGSGAANGNTLDLQITNPSTDAVASVGTVSPATAVTISGSTTLSPPSGPTTDQVMRGGKWFNGGTEQPYYWAQ